MRLLKLAYLLFLSAFLSAQQLSFALEQINADVLIKKGFSGKGVKIGVIDGGFLGANKAASLGHLFKNERIAGYKDYLDPGAAPFNGTKTLDDGHGTEVLSLIGGIDTKKGVQYGLATHATFYLARTDHGAYEKRAEEDLAIEAMTWMAQEGVKIINISLGYTNGFEDSKENYTPEMMDGTTTEITKTVDQLAEKYGLLVIVAAGNDGDKSWKTLGAPADATSALTVGATKFKIWDEATYSSSGPGRLAYVKPEVSCYSSVGTSFSTPVITGLAACILEMYPSFTGEELKEKILQICNLYHFPNNKLGYGVPDAELLFKNRSPKKNLKATGNKTTITMEENPIYLPVYHKNGFVVQKKQVLRTKKNSIKIKRYKGCETTTVIIHNEPVEITWIN